MHPFSIDYITRESEMIKRYGQEDDAGSTYDNEDSRLTPSPSDSGLGSDNLSYTEQEKQKSPSDKISIAETLLALDKKSRGAPSPEGGDEKPSHSYIALISMAILSVPEKKMLLCDIYQYIMDNFAYYNNGDKAWRNSIRHNLSLNECFIKNGRADNGKGNYWSIHPACINDFSKGDFRRRQARRRARKSVREPSNGGMSMAHRYNVGYVPMTASHLSYHPYSGAGSHSLLYPQPTVASLPTGAHAQTTTSANLLPSSSSSSSIYSHSTGSTQGIFPGSPSFNPTQASQFSTISAAAVQRFFADEARVALAAQAFGQQHIQTPLHFQNW